MIALHADPLMDALILVRRRIEWLRCVHPLPYAELALLAIEEVRLLRADCERRRQ